ncbi:MAG: hypothetical protein R3E99_13545 [Burkholderiaceae bacterium]
MCPCWEPGHRRLRQACGRGGLRAQQLGRLTELARVYWYTVEFGLLQQEVACLYGSGIASSYTESRFCLDGLRPMHIRFELERVMRTNPTASTTSRTYFVLRDLDELLEFARVDFAPLYERAHRAPQLPTR